MINYASSFAYLKINISNCVSQKIKRSPEDEV